MEQDIREVADILRAHRFELVDDKGQVRAVLGPEPDTETGVSLALLSPEGEHRVTLGLSDDAAWALFELGGNCLITMGIHEPHSDAVGARAFFNLCDVTGTPVIGWRVTDDGELIVSPSP